MSNPISTYKLNLSLPKILLENEDLGFYTLGRYGKWTYNSMEDSMLWAKELADKLNSKEK